MEHRHSHNQANALLDQLGVASCPPLTPHANQILSARIIRYIIIMDYININIIIPFIFFHLFIITHWLRLI